MGYGCMAKTLVLLCMIVGVFATVVGCAPRHDSESSVSPTPSVTATTSVPTATHTQQTLRPTLNTTTAAVTTGTTSAEPIPALVLLSVKEQGEWVMVETSYGAFRYPTAFADILAPEVVCYDNVAQIQFIAQIAEQSLVAYTLHYRAATGIRCGTLRLPNTTEEIAVSVEFAEVDHIPADWQDTFYAVQETFNDVVSSMAEDSRFVREEI